jgi:hypothetical protein
MRRRLLRLYASADCPGRTLSLKGTLQPVRESCWEHRAERIEATGIKPVADRGLMVEKQARQDSNLQPPVLEPTPSNAGLQRLLIFEDLALSHERWRC